MPNFFDNAIQNNILPFRESVLTDISPEKARLIEAISQLDITPLDETEQLKTRQLFERLACTLLRDDSLSTVRRIRNFKDRLERDLLRLETEITNKNQCLRQDDFSVALIFSMCLSPILLAIAASFLLPLLPVWGSLLTAFLVDLVIMPILGMTKMDDDYYWVTQSCLLVIGMVALGVQFFWPVVGFALTGIISAYPVGGLLYLFSQRLITHDSVFELNTRVEEQEQEIKDFIQESLNEWDAYDLAQEQQQNEADQVNVPVAN